MNSLINFLKLKKDIMQGKTRTLFYLMRIRDEIKRYGLLLQDSKGKTTYKIIRKD